MIMNDFVSAIHKTEPLKKHERSTKKLAKKFNAFFLLKANVNNILCSIALGQICKRQLTRS